MVKFGRHLEAFLAENQGSNLYVVPYCEIRDHLVEKESADSQVFTSEWTCCLEKAKTDFDQAMESLWRMVFEGISTDSASRGTSPDTAFRMFLSQASVEESQELLSHVKYTCEISLTNAEALRKLVKKFDKRHAQSLSPFLLPKLYAANFTVGQPTLEDGLLMLREALETDFDEDEPQSHESANSLTVGRRGQQHDAAVNRRREELAWLKELVQSIAPSEIQHIVAHRGFHNPLDRSDKRPLENSLAAYEAAWTNGIHLCECDITLTKDEKLVLAHDDDFSRLALDKDLPHKKVRDLTFRELISLPLKSGIRPPLLIDVLRSARAIGGDSKLVIEVKPGNNAAASALARMFIRHPDLMEQCAVVMSFDLFCMHTLRTDLQVLEAPVNSIVQRRHRSRMSLGNIALLNIDGSEGFLPLGPKRDSFQEGFVQLGPKRDSFQEGSAPVRPRQGSFDHFGVGLSISERSESFFPPPGSSPSVRNVAPSAGALYKLDEQRRIPKLMLLTVADKPIMPSEKLQVGVLDLQNVDQWLHRNDGSLDGVYLQFEKEMLSVEGKSALRNLASRYSVGVWGHAHKDPDDYETFRQLVRDGMVSFVNSDLPKAFKKKSFRGSPFG